MGTEPNQDSFAAAMAAKAQTPLCVKRVLDTTNGRAGVNLNSKEICELKEWRTALEDQYLCTDAMWDAQYNALWDNVMLWGQSYLFNQNGGN